MLWADVGPRAASTRGDEHMAHGQAWSGPGLTVAVSGGEQSLHVRPDLVVVVLGRIDELCGSPVDATAAAAAVASAWRTRGPTVMSGAAGDFVVLAHERPEGRTWVVRDMVGTIPVYLLSGRRGVIASTSLPRLVTALPTPTPDDRWTHAYLDGQWPPLGSSPYAGVRLLPPGSVAKVSGVGFEEHRYDAWRWSPDGLSEDMDQAQERFQHLFDRAVQRRLTHAGSGTAVTTSGGLDSSSVLVTARHLAPGKPLTALCLGFQDARGDERTYQRAVAAKASARLEWVDVTRAGGPFGDGPDDLFGRHGAPPLVLNWFLHSTMCDRARQLGIQRVLDGEDGDGVVGGNPIYLADLLAKGRVLHWLTESRALAHARGVPAARLRRRSLGNLRSSVSAGTVGRSYPAAVRALVKDGYLSALTAEVHRLWAALPFGIAHPFLDRQLLEHALVMPREYRIAAGRSKVLLRHAMNDRLPETIAQRVDKAELSSPFMSAVNGAQRHFVDAGLQLAEQDPLLKDRSRPSSENPASVVADVRLATVALWRDWLLGGVAG